MKQTLSPLRFPRFWVAPRAGAWIETTLVSLRSPWASGRPPRGEDSWKNRLNLSERMQRRGRRREAGWISFSLTI